MGGTNDKTQTSRELINQHDKRVVINNQKLWSAILTLEREHIDDFPFSAREVMREMDKSESVTIITRERGGLRQFLCDYRTEAITQLKSLVQAEQTNTGKISDKFCRNLGFLITTYAPLFTIDIITDSHRNTKTMLNIIRPLIMKERFVFFLAEFYSLLQAWHEEDFSKEALLARYEKRMKALFAKYQISRPDMSVSSRHISSEAIRHGEMIADDGTGRWHCHPIEQRPRHTDTR